MKKFTLTDKKIAFAIAVAGGAEQQQAYINHVATRKDIKIGTAATNACQLMKKKEIQEIIQQTKKAHAEALINQSSSMLAKEFSTPLLTVDELDSFHSAIVQGLVDVEEVIPVYTSTYDDNGVIKMKQTSFMRVKRPPNIRERQISIDALYKRFGNYSPSRFFGAMGKVNEEGDLENVQRMLILSTGEKIPIEP